MTTYEIVVTRTFEDGGVTCSKSLPITLPCANFREELLKLGLDMNNFVQKEIDVNITTELPIDHPLRVYIENSIACHELSFYQLHMLATAVSSILTDDEMEKLMLFINYSWINDCSNCYDNENVLKAIDNFRKADYYEAEGYVDLTESLLWLGYFDDFFGLPISKTNPTAMCYIDIEMLSSDIVERNFVASPNERYFLKLRDL